MMDNFKKTQLVKEICAKGGLLGFEALVDKLISRIHEADCKISCCDTCFDTKINQDLKGEQKSHIQLGFKTIRERPIHLIWDIFHEFGHHLSGLPQPGEERTVERETQAWNLGLNVLHEYPDLLSEEADYLAYAKSKLQTYINHQSFKRAYKSHEKIPYAKIMNAGWLISHQQFMAKAVEWTSQVVASVELQRKIIELDREYFNEKTGYDIEKLSDDIFGELDIDIYKSLTQKEAYRLIAEYIENRKSLIDEELINAKKGNNISAALKMTEPGITEFRDLFVNDEAYKKIIDFLVSESFIDPSTNIWVDRSSGHKAIITSLIQSLRTKGYYKHSLKIKAEDIVKIAAKTFQVSFSKETAQRDQQGLSPKISSIPPYKV
jgi:hypothetical protein